MQVIAKERVALSVLVKKSLPDDVIQTLLDAISNGFEFAYVMSCLTDAGYRLVIVPADDETEPDEDDMGFMEPDDDDVQMFKGYSFAVENAIIARNRKRAMAASAHDFKAARYHTRDGRVRCLMCGGGKPDSGVCKDGDAAPSVDGPDVNSVHVPSVNWKKPRKLGTDNSVGSVSTAVGIDKAESLLPLIKEADKRFTLGPMYVPDSMDAHMEWTDAEELQNAVWDYVRAGDRRIRLQHNTDVVAGEWVEILAWPFEVTVPMISMETGQIVEYTYPANTVFLGVIWEPWAWELVKAGKVRGYSIGGKAQRIEVDMPEGS